MLRIMSRDLGKIRDKERELLKRDIASGEPVIGLEVFICTPVLFPKIPLPWVESKVVDRQAIAECAPTPVQAPNNSRRRRRRRSDSSNYVDSFDVEEKGQTPPSHVNGVQADTRARSVNPTPRKQLKFTDKQVCGVKYLRNCRRYC